MSTLKNVVNGDAVDAALQELGAGKSPAIVKWIMSQAKKELLTDVECFRKLNAMEISRARIKNPWMVRQFSAGTAIYEFDPEDQDFERFRQDLEHAVAYLMEKEAAGQKNLGPIPWETAKDEGAQAVSRAALMAKIGEGPADKTLVHKYPNGFAWWDLRTAKALKNESASMGHCVGNDGMSYTRRVAAGECRILSLRDKTNEPHATIELDATAQTIKQLKGKGNKPIVPKYKPACVGLLRDLIGKNEVQRLLMTDLLRSDIGPQDLGVTLDESGLIIR